MTSLICPNCKGNGYNRLRFEAEESIEQCKVCDSKGELEEDKYYRQSWDGAKVQGIITRCVYYGPILDSDSFPNYKIHSEQFALPTLGWTYYSNSNLLSVKEQAIICPFTLTAPVQAKL